MFAFTMSQRAKLCPTNAQPQPYFNSSEQATAFPLHLPRYHHHHQQHHSISDKFEAPQPCTTLTILTSQMHGVKYKLPFGFRQGLRACVHNFKSESVPDSLSVPAKTHTSSLPTTSHQKRTLSRIKASKKFFNHITRLFKPSQTADTVSPGHADDAHSLPKPAFKDDVRLTLDLPEDASELNAEDIIFVIQGFGTPNPKLLCPPPSSTLTESSDEHTANTHTTSPVQRISLSSNCPGTSSGTQTVCSKPSSNRSSIAPQDSVNDSNHSALTEVTSVSDTSITANHNLGVPPAPFRPLSQSSSASSIERLVIIDQNKLQSERESGMDSIGQNDISSNTAFFGVPIEQEDPTSVSMKADEEDTMLDLQVQGYCDKEPEDNDKVVNQDYNNENNYEDEEEEEEETGETEGRCDWDTIRSISDECLCRLLLNTLDHSNSLTLDCVSTLRRSEGSFNMAAHMGLFRNGKVEEYVIRIPAHGTEALWTGIDSHLLEAQVGLMKQIELNCWSVPVPKIFGHSSSLDNCLGAPYILMEKLSGYRASEIWFDDTDYDDRWLDADCPSEETHRKRVNFLDSLARAMVDLQELEFDMIGLPWIPTPYYLSEAPNASSQDVTTGPTYHWPYKDDVHKVVERGPFESTQAYIKAALDAHLNREELSKHPDLSTSMQVQNRLAVRKILDMVFSAPAFNPSAKLETFTICHTDLDLQNILVDENGCVTGIVDWDGAFAAPRCIGTAAVPRFLQQDWFPDDDGEAIEESPYMGLNSEYYRSIYAAAFSRHQMEQNPDANLEDTDARFTLKSPIYQAAFAAIYEGGSLWNFTDKLLREIPDFRIDTTTFKVKLGAGWPKAEIWLEKRIQKVCATTMPDDMDSEFGS
ncbi:unnamed protein product [Periconia digitata]|uniref:Aminoglycoside phosphotransferase domain-containing protein n=1 Tax=Periconia digitata TaxID=1303443 RepID=A0A9W4URJ0_9PLEO|nr:unnamed protein product [Periconia digitata]